MPIPFTCPHCGAGTNVLEEFAGQSGPCAQCGQTVTVPLHQAGAAPMAVPAKRTSTALVVKIVIIVLLMVAWSVGPSLMALLLPSVQAAREAGRRAQCTNNMKQIGLAMLIYHETYGCFPPAYTVDENGRPLHSWRVLLLPYMEEEALYDQIKLDEPWDSPPNRALADLMPDVYRCPSGSALLWQQTSYVVITGPGTVFNAAETVSISDISDGTSRTILVVEASDAGINWMEPRDIEIDQIEGEINDLSGQGISSEHPGIVNVLHCDGSVHSLFEGLDAESIKAKSTIAGGEKQDDVFLNELY